MLFAAPWLFGFSWGIGSLGSPLVAELFGLSAHRANRGLVNFGYSIGTAAGPYFLGRIFDLTGSYRLSFHIDFIMAFIGLLLAVSLKIKMMGQQKIRPLA